MQKFPPRHPGLVDAQLNSILGMLFSCGILGALDYCCSVSVFSILTSDSLSC